jgi:group II intron reverse transcriptase/maturase
MLQLAEELRSGRYQPHPPHAFSIAKANGDRRELRAYAIRDRVVQRALLQILQARTDLAMSPSSFGYRPGRSVRDAVAKVQKLLANGLSWVVDADIERCFDSIPRARMLDEVTGRLGDEQAAEWVARCLGWFNTQQREQAGIPQGAVLAPWLCNVYLWRLDDHMDSSGTAMVRFADDFVLLTATRRRAERAMAECAGIIDALRLRLHPIKTVIVDASKPFRFLGQWLSATCQPSCAPCPL